MNEELFYIKHTLANNRMPFCSEILKARRLQRFFEDGDMLVFGIGADEVQRAQRLVGVYQTIAVKTSRWPTLCFPLIPENVSSDEIDMFLSNAGIREPELYRLGFKHNNCSGGCVRAGKRQWLMLLSKLPDVYMDRERVERDFRRHFGKNVSFLKGITLEQLRLQHGQDDNTMHEADDEIITSECIGICNLMS
ncbi:MAG: hypothetical protein QXT45_04230 [Candidatus Bilamarchaeaceae archaeon]